MNSVFKLRDYQQDIIEQTINHLKTTSEPAVIDACVGAGKTLIISHIARHVVKKSGRVICMAHTQELILGAYKTFTAYAPDIKCGIFSAALGEKDTEHDVIYCTEKSLVNSLHLFEAVDLLLIDEAHRVNDGNEKTCYMKIIEHFQSLNSKLRILGLTGTAFRLSTGSITGNKRLFKKVVASVGVVELIEQCYLTKPIAPTAELKQYDFSEVQIKQGRYLESDLNIAVSDERLTRTIINDVIQRTKDRNKVLIFASTLQHAKEILSYLPENSGYLDGSLSKTEREQVLSDFAQGEIKYLVNKDILTTGYDEPAIDAIAVLRPTESRGLFIQMVGRCLRLFNGKNDALVLDYAGNLENHGDGSLDSLFSKSEPEKDQSKNSDQRKMNCPDCGYENKATARKCKCGHFFISKKCPGCKTKNDITARYCSSCQYELIDPNDKLSCHANKTNLHQSNVIDMQFFPYVKTKQTLKVSFTTEDGQTISQFFAPKSNYIKFFIRRNIRRGMPTNQYLEMSATELTEHRNDFRKPDILVYKKDGKYFKVIEWHNKKLRKVA